MEDTAIFGTFSPCDIGKNFWSSKFRGSMYSRGWDHKKRGLYVRIENNLAGCKAKWRCDENGGGPQIEGQLYGGRTGEAQAVPDAVEYNRGYMADAVLLHENNSQT